MRIHDAGMSEDRTVNDVRDAMAELVSRLTSHFGPGLQGLYLFGSLPAGWFRPGKSDIDLLAVLESDVGEGEALRALESLHADFVAEYPAWHQRVEVGYVSRKVLQTFADVPAGRAAVIGPGEPLNVKDVGSNWLLDWHSVCTQGETLVGPPPLELGPLVAPDAYRRAVQSQLREWQKAVRAPEVAYVPAHQGYIVATVCRALYALATGEQTSKENAVKWAAEQLPESATFISEAYGWYSADLSGPHKATIQFVDQALVEAERFGPQPAIFKDESER